MTANREFMLSDLARSGLETGDLRATPTSDGYSIAFWDHHKDQAVLCWDGKPFTRTRYAVERDGQKYHTRTGTGQHVYVPKAAHDGLAADPECVLVLTEGEKKATKASKSGCPCLGLVGIWGWLASKDDRAPGVDKLHPDLKPYLVNGHAVMIVYDSDAADLSKARDFDSCSRRLAQALDQVGHPLFRVTLPPGEGGAKQGLDDLIMATGLEGEDLTAWLWDRAEKVDPYFSGWNAAALAETEFPDLVWVVRDLLPEGLGLLASKPKLGKSWMVLDMCRSVAAGGRFLGKYSVDQGQALYLALEDSARRVKGRLETLGVDPALSGLEIWTELPYADYKRNVRELDAWLKHHPDARLVVIDTKARMLPAAGAGRKDAYADETANLAKLQALAHRHHCAVLVVTHTKKAATADVFDGVLGSTGQHGTADVTWLLQRGRCDADGVMAVTGRDVEEQTLGLAFADGKWLAEEDGGYKAETQAQREIVQAVRGGVESSRQLVAQLGKHKTTVLRTLGILRDRGCVDWNKTTGRICLV